MSKVWPVEIMLNFHQKVPAIFSYDNIHARVRDEAAGPYLMVWGNPPDSADEEHKEGSIYFQTHEEIDAFAKACHDLLSAHEEEPKVTDTPVPTTQAPKVHTQRNVGEGYMEVLPGTVLLEGDEYTTIGQFQGGNPEWVTTWLAGTIKQEGTHEIHRRKVMQPLPEPTAPKVVDPGEGYTLLPVGEMLREGDQCYQVGGGWAATRMSGTQVVAGDTYRRPKPIEAGQGYALLPINTTLKRGDEYWDTTKKDWMKSVRDGYAGDPGLTYRRKI